MDRFTKEFLNMVFKLNQRQKESINFTIGKYFTNRDYEQLESVISLYKRNYSMQELVDAYLLIISDTAEETRFFLENDRYRYTTFDETERLVYNNKDYMGKYMIGLAISDYLWPNHIRLSHWYGKIIKRISGKRYLEVGPGHGRYFCEAVKEGKFECYDAIDVSEISVVRTREYLDYFATEQEKIKANIFLQNAYEYFPEIRYDMIVIAEVLEHLEKPFEMLQKLYDISNDGAYLYVTVPVNAPAIDHIYLFRSIDEVESMIIETGYKVEERLYAAAGDMDIERAIKKRNAVVVGLLARKVGN